jgi:hypothetical protein
MAMLDERFTNEIWPFRASLIGYPNGGYFFE